MTGAPGPGLHGAVPTGGCRPAEQPRDESRDVRAADDHVRRFGPAPARRRRRRPDDPDAAARAGARDGARGHAARGAERQRLVARVGEDAVALHLAGGPVLVLHPQTARDLLLSQTRLDAPPLTRRGRRRRRPTRGRHAVGGGRCRRRRRRRGRVADRGRAAADAGVARTRAGRADAGAGFLGRVVVTTVQILGGPRADALVEAAAERTAEAIARRLDGQVADAVHELRADRRRR
ncbi:MAG: hypothetical protein MZW92_19320 [Comamonadaceae bacterium]|nr:hypothetical protein [Comamonadaceae bacterium]